jgi:glycosyltransferase involved in cell wall biosynthesis
VTPLVTAVIPTRNRSARVVRAIASAQRQTLREIEILVVDDASSDETEAVVKATAADDPRVRVLRQPDRAGAPAARNRGLDERRGEFVAFLDDDDRWLPTKLERQVALLRARPDVVLVGCHHRLIVEGGGDPVDFCGPTQIEADDLLWVNILGTASNAVVAPGRLGDDVRFDPAFPTYQDWDFYLRCNRSGRVAVAPEVLCEYVVHAEPERLTNQLLNRLAGHELLLQRHAAAMSPSCVAYHRARMRVLATTSRREKLRLAPKLLRDTPPVALRALLTESVNGRIGRLRHDPGRPMRHLQRLARATRSTGRHR